MGEVIKTSSDGSSTVTNAWVVKQCKDNSKTEAKVQCMACVFSGCLTALKTLNFGAALKTLKKP